MVRRQDVEDAQGGRNSGGSGNIVGDDLHRDLAGNHGTVGGKAWWLQEATVKQPQSTLAGIPRGG